MTSFKFLIQEDGVFAERFRVNNADNNMVLLPEGMDLADALMVTDMMSTGFYGAEMANVKIGDPVVVFGIGPVGLMAVAGAQLMGAGKIYATGTRQNCAELALEYGATEIISYKDSNTVDTILEYINQNDATLTLITNRDILDLIYENDHDDVFDSLIKSGRIEVILTSYDLEMFFTSCDNFSCLFLFFDKMLFDDSEMLLIKDEENIKNARNMFNHFKSLSIC